MDNNNNNQIQNANQNQNQNEKKNLEKKVTKNLIKNYSNLLNGNSFKDFSIFVENKSNPFEIKVHKSILSSRSPFFNKFLREESLSISLNQFNKKEMESILSYIYYGNISFENQENLIQLLEISIYFKLNLLKEFIQKKISNSINYSNFFQFFFQNRNLNSNEIEIKCFELINQNFSQIQNNENLFNLTKEEIIKFIQFKQEKKEIFQFDFFQFLNNWIKKRNQRLKGKKENEKEIEKKRLFHSFFSLFDKDSISKQDFDKLKQFQIFLPKSFLVDIQNKVIQDNQKEIENKNKEIEDKNKEIEEKWKKENEELKSKFELMELQKIFSDSEIVKDIEYAKKLKEWINDNDFFSKMKKGFSAKKDGFDSKIGIKQLMGKEKHYGEWINDSNAFIFSLRNDKNDRKPEKFLIKQGDAIYSNLDVGPVFGEGADFVLTSNLQPGYSNFGRSYNLPNGITYGTNEAKIYLAGSNDKWKVDEVETFFI
ncbi:pep-cterm sorting domain-containing protein [Anaeramoeba ignava]|uniref:Pep-cterm sorting domain-containing protein n=1 Tax=Anaeramoeba ignava TaxID=1746090 RepID=A0A9Q0RH54_ANAIG|nr:pep-cterm sorting domain-containing protein [Anaeramoeba ignava]